MNDCSSWLDGQKEEARRQGAIGIYRALRLLVDNAVLGHGQEREEFRGNELPRGLVSCFLACAVELSQEVNIPGFQSSADSR